MARLVCPETGEEAPLASAACGSPPTSAAGGGLPEGGALFGADRLFEVDWGLDAATTPAPAVIASRARGLWRFRELVDPDIPPDEVVSLAEGDTPLHDAPSVARWAGVEALGLKHEGRNPTGSFKDRGMTVAVSRARRAGATLLACASTGNTSASLAAYAARAGLASVVLVPAGRTASAKLAQAIAHGARVLSVRGGFDDAMRLVRELAAAGRVALVNSANPFRLEGQKTILLEVMEAFGWRGPDWLVFPAGNLGNAAAFGKAIRELRALGWIDRAPRLAAVQAAGAAPFAAAFERGFDALVPVEADTLATAIRIGAPVSYHRAARAIRETDGIVVSVPDDDILEAKARVDAAGVGAEPASCASVAGLRALVAGGVVRPGESVVALLTGHLLKDPETTLAYHEGRVGRGELARPAVEVEATIEALGDALERLAQ